MCASTFGYISFLDETKPLLIEREPLKDSKDYLMLIGKCVIVFDMIGSFLL